MRIENMTHCQQLYESIMSSLEMYKDLASNSGCEGSRKLRSVRASCKTQLYSKIANCSKPSISSAPKMIREDAIQSVTFISVAMNFFFIMLTFIKLLVSLNSCKIRDRRSSTRKSLRSDLKQSQQSSYDDHEDTRNALLEAFELSRRS